MPAGRPSKYKPECCQAIIEFFDKPPYERKVKTVATKKGPVEIEYDDPTDLPFLTDFAKSIGVNQDTLHEWIKKHPEFSEAFKTAKEKQEKIVVINAMRKLYDSTFSIFTLKNIAGWRDKQEIEHQGSVEKPLVIIDAGKDPYKDGSVNKK